MEDLRESVIVVHASGMKEKRQRERKKEQKERERKEEKKDVLAEV